MLIKVADGTMGSLKILGVRSIETQGLNELGQGEHKRALIKSQAMYDITVRQR